jgi:hypothetical protein
MRRLLHSNWTFTQEAEGSSPVAPAILIHVAYCACARFDILDELACLTTFLDTTTCSVIQPEAVVLDVQKALGHGRH